MRKGAQAAAYGSEDPMPRLIILAATLALAAACGTTRASHDAAPGDAVVTDGGLADGGLVDAGAPPGNVVDLTGAGGRMSGGTYTIDFEIGPNDQVVSSGGTMTIENGAAIKP